MRRVFSASAYRPSVMRCSASRVLASQKPEISVDDILKVKDKKFPGNTAEIHVIEVKEVNKTQYEIKLNVRNTAANAGQDYNWTNSVHQRLELLDAKGIKYASGC